MGRRSKPEPSWFESSAATFVAGVLGLAVIGGLVTAVITMSSRWSSPETSPSLPPITSLPAPDRDGAADSSTSSSSTSYTTSVQVSTTDIGLPSTPPGGPGAIGGRPRTSAPDDPADPADPADSTDTPSVTVTRTSQPPPS